MKKVILFFLFIQTLSAQKKDKDAIITIIAEETCECFAKKNVDVKSLSYENMLAVFGSCMLGSYQNNQSKFKDKDKLDLSDRKLMRMFGEEVGLKMVTFCPNAMLDVGMKKIEHDNITNKKDNTEIVDEAEDSSITGTILQIKSDQFITFSVKEASGRTVEFILLEEFNNSFLLTESLLKQNDIVDVYYYESELFDAKINKFITYKVITDIIKK